MVISVLGSCETGLMAGSLDEMEAEDYFSLKP